MFKLADKSIRIGFRAVVVTIVEEFKAKKTQENGKVRYGNWELPGFYA